MQVANRWRCSFGQACYDPRYDLDGDGTITILDIMLVAVQWGPSCSAAAGRTTSYRFGT